MVALAGVADLEVLIGPVDQPRALKLLEMASAVAESYCRRSFSQVINDLITVRVASPSHYLVLPSRPVTAVSSIVGPDGATITPDRYSWSRAGIVLLEEDWWAVGAHKVTHTHGWAQIPADVVMAVCMMAAAVLDNPPAGVRSESEQVADTTKTVSYGNRSPVVDASVVPLLRPYRLTVNTVALSR